MSETMLAIAREDKQIAAYQRETALRLAINFENNNNSLSEVIINAHSFYKFISGEYVITEASQKSSDTIKPVSIKKKSIKKKSNK